MIALSELVQGSEINLAAIGEELGKTLAAIVDYRGDVTLNLKDGSQLAGFVYNCSPKTIELYPQTSPAPISLSLDQVESILISGSDTAKGKSWEDWQRKKSSEREAIKAAPIAS